MSASAVNSGALVTLQELKPSSPNFKPGGAFRVTGKAIIILLGQRLKHGLSRGGYSMDVSKNIKNRVILYPPRDKLVMIATNTALKDVYKMAIWLQEYTLETAVAVIIDGNASLKVDTRHLKLNLRPGSLYQFIGELHIEPSNEAILKARVGRNVDGLDLNLYLQSMQLLREFQAAQISSWTA